MRYKNYNAEFVFGLQTLRKGLQTRGIGKLGAAKALSQAGLETASKKALKGNANSMKLAARVGKLDEKLTSGVLGTDIGQLAKNARNNVANKLTDARKGLNKRAGILGTDVKDAKELLPNSRTNKLKRLDKLLKKPIPSYKPVNNVNLNKLNASPLYIQNRSK